MSWPHWSPPRANYKNAKSADSGEHVGSDSREGGRVAHASERQQPSDQRSCRASVSLMPRAEASAMRSSSRSRIVSLYTPTLSGSTSGTCVESPDHERACAAHTRIPVLLFLFAGGALQTCAGQAASVPSPSVESRNTRSTLSPAARTAFSAWGGGKPFGHSGEEPARVPGPPLPVVSPVGAAQRSCQWGWGGTAGPPFVPGVSAAPQWSTSTRTLALQA